MLAGKAVLPLAVGIHEAMRAFLAEPESAAQRKALASALRWFSSTASYLDACLNDVIRDRFDCDGEPAGTLSDTDRAAAAARLVYLANKPRKPATAMGSPTSAGGEPGHDCGHHQGCARREPGPEGATGANGSRPLLTLPGRAPTIAKPIARGYPQQ